jgi:hypothetical protein
MVVSDQPSAFGLRHCVPNDRLMADGSRLKAIAKHVRY